MKVKSTRGWSSHLYDKLSRIPISGDVAPHWFVESCKFSGTGDPAFPQSDVFRTNTAWR